MLLEYHPFKSIPGIRADTKPLQESTSLHSSHRLPFTFQPVTKEGFVLDRSIAEFFVYSPQRSLNRPIDRLLVISPIHQLLNRSYTSDPPKSSATRCRYRKKSRNGTEPCFVSTNQHQQHKPARYSTNKPFFVQNNTPHPLFTHCTTPRQYPYTDAPCFIPNDRRNPPSRISKER